MTVVWRHPRMEAFLGFLVVGLSIVPTAPAQQLSHPPAVRPLGARVAVCPDTFGIITGGLRPLRDGRVLVSDVKQRRVLIYDSLLTHPMVIMDSSRTGQRAFGQSGALLAYGLDSTIFIDMTAMAFVVIDPAGVINRIIAPPSASRSDLAMLMSGWGKSGFDAKMRLVYPGIASGDLGAMPAAGIPVRDSFPVLRATLSARTVDTAGFLSVLQSGGSVTTSANGSTVAHGIIQPVPRRDDWALVSDGSIALVRAFDYHIDWVNADGSRSSSPRMAHDWQRITDSMKDGFIDSIGRVPRRGADVHVIAPADIPDYWPPFRAAQYTPAVRADADNNVWILQAPPEIDTGPKADAPAPVYDIVNREGVVTDRVQLPPSLAIAGFGPGVVYLTVREGAGTKLVKYRIR